MLAIALVAGLAIGSLPAAQVASAQVPSTAVNQQAPANLVENGGFEDGFENWERSGRCLRFGWLTHTAQLVSPGAADTDQAMLIEDCDQSSTLNQRLDSTADGPVSTLDFYAKVESGQGSGGGNRIQLAANCDASGCEDKTVRMKFKNAEIHFEVWNGDTTKVDAPTDNEWHHYTVVLSSLAGTGLLLQDGMLIADASGDPGNTAAPGLVSIGDPAGANWRSGPAPDVIWDEIYYGPGV